MFGITHLLIMCYAKFKNGNFLVFELAKFYVKEPKLWKNGPKQPQKRFLYTTLLQFELIIIIQTNRMSTKFPANEKNFSTELGHVGFW